MQQQQQLQHNRTVTTDARTAAVGWLAVVWDGCHEWRTSAYTPSSAVLTCSPCVCVVCGWCSLLVHSFIHSFSSVQHHNTKLRSIHSVLLSRSQFCDLRNRAHPHFKQQLQHRQQQLSALVPPPLTKAAQFNRA